MFLNLDPSRRALALNWSRALCRLSNLLLLLLFLLLLQRQGEVDNVIFSLSPSCGTVGRKSGSK